MILHLSCMRRNVNRKDYNDRENVSATPFLRSQVSGCLLQTAQTWANAGVCSASCAHAFGCMYVCLFVCLFYRQFR